MYSRWLEPIIKKSLLNRRVLAITGARQCGKTTLAKALLTPESVYQTLDNPDVLKVAQLDPVSFIQHGKHFMVIDEIQREPELLLAIKLQVDEDDRPGQFIVTGSADLYNLPKIQESLAGRIKHLRLRPLSQGELEGVQPEFLKRAFVQDWPSVSGKEGGRNEILERSLLGGYPEILSFDQAECRDWHKSYLESLLNHDMRELLGIRRLDAMQKLIHVVAAWSSKYMNVNAIGTQLEVQRKTLDNYLSALEQFFLLERIPAWYSTDYDYVGRQDKLFMTDTGLMASQLNWNLKQVALDPDRSGKLIETFVFNQLASLVDAAPNHYKLYHYRDRLKREVDFIVEATDGEGLLGIEVKAGTSPGIGDIKHLQWFQHNVAKNRVFTGIVLHTGSSTYRIGQDNVWAVPIQALWT